MENILHESRDRRLCIARKLRPRSPTNRLRKNSDFDLVLKGRGFSRAVSATKSIAALAAEVTLCAREGVFPQPVRGCTSVPVPTLLAQDRVFRSWVKPCQAPVLTIFR